MKILKYIIFVLIALVFLFLAIGFLKPSVNYGHEIIVDKTMKEAWAVHQDETKLGQWLEGFKSIDLISGEPGNVGSKYKVIVNPGEGQPDFEMIETIVSKKDADHIQLSFDSEMMLFDQTTTFSEKDGKITIKTDSNVKGKGMMMRSIFALMEMFGGSFKAQEAKNLEALKKVINENTTNYFPALNVMENNLKEATRMTN